MIDCEVVNRFWIVRRLEGQTVCQPEGEAYIVLIGDPDSLEHMLGSFAIWDGRHLPEAFSTGHQRRLSSSLNFDGGLPYSLRVRLLHVCDRSQ